MKQYPAITLMEKEKKAIERLNVDFVTKYRSAVEWGFRRGLLRHRGAVDEKTKENVRKLVEG